jgi:beta-phosphoglucomutase
VADGDGVIFDMDGVLVDSYGAHFESWNRAAAERGLILTEPVFASVFGQVSTEIIRRLWMKDRRFTPREVEAFRDDKERIYREILSRGVPLMDGADDLIGRLRAAGFTMAIGTSGPEANVALVRGALANGRSIDAVVTGADVTKGKPDPQVFQAAARKLGVAPARCAVIEDSVWGLEAARRAGMAAIGLTGTADREALAARAHRVVDSLRELTPEGIRELLQPGRDSE